MSTRTSQLVEQTLRQWDDNAEIDDEERFACVMAPVKPQRIRKGQAAHAMQPQASVAGPGYTVSSAWENFGSHRR